ncbi:mevalonate kinase [Eremococcus coleocola]|uniref:mevalonate kinase n=1 Tax=Eremococcus coleocola TaxID=88132 RepID=UPI0004201A04|nr:mevalonate kinase [Eremococcus coleocola]
MTDWQNKYVSQDMVRASNCGYGHAHSKIILMGEHAVVYDYPAIAIPFTSVQVRVKVQANQIGRDFIQSSIYTGPLTTVPKQMENIQALVNLTRDSFQFDRKALLIKIDSDIPAGRGMGSSAAVSVALVRAICDYFNYSISDYQLHLLVNQAEAIAHESTSGLDTLITASDKPVIYRKSQKPFNFPLDLNAYLVLADSGMEGRTQQAVSRVLQLKLQQKEFVAELMESIGNFVEQAYTAIQDKNPAELGRLMTYNHYYLNQLGVSNERLDRIINASWMAGALGAKLTGGGMGGCVITLAENLNQAKAIAKAMKQAGAHKTWTLNLNKFA